MTIEQYIYRTDPYRSINQSSPWPLPLVRVKCSEQFTLRLATKLQLGAQIKNLLQIHGYQDNVPYTFRSCTKPGYDHGDVPQIMMSILMTVPDMVPTKGWSELRQALEILLSNVGFDDVYVEIIDADRAYRMSFHPIHPKHPFLTVYNHCKTELLERLFKHVPTAWTSMCAFQVLRPGLGKRPSVVVIVEPCAVADWEAVINEFYIIISAVEKKVLKPHERVKWTVEFTPGLSTGNPKSEAAVDMGREKSFATTFTTYPKLGESIGFHYQDGGGTLGGFFKIKCGEKIHYGALTNYHVSTRTVEPDMAADEHGVCYGSSQYSEEMVFPSRTDARETLRHCNHLLSTQQTFIHDLVNNKDEKTKRASSPGRQERFEQRITAEKAEEARCKERSNQAKGFPKTLGKVLVSSGRAMSAKLEVLDWAFIEINNTDWAKIKNMNTLPVATNFRFSGARLAHELGSDERNYTNQDPEFQIQGFKDVIPGAWYFKVGRTSEITSGICNGIEMYVNIKHTRQVYDNHGSPVKFTEKLYSQDHVILSGSFDPEDASVQQTSFSMSGDSGSLIIDSRGNCAGILWGSLSGACNNLNRWNRDYVNVGTITTSSSLIDSMRTKAKFSRQTRNTPTGVKHGVYPSNEAAKVKLGHH